MPKWKIGYINEHGHKIDVTVDAESVRDIADHWVDFYRKNALLVLRLPKDRIYRVELDEE